MYNNEPFATFREVAEAAGLDEGTAFDRYTSSLLPLTLISVDMDTMLSKEESAIAFAHMGVNAPECMNTLRSKVDKRRHDALVGKYESSMNDAAKAVGNGIKQNNRTTARIQSMIEDRRDRRKEAARYQEMCSHHDYDGPGMFSHWDND